MTFCVDLIKIFVVLFTIDLFTLTSMEIGDSIQAKKNVRSKIEEAVRDKIRNDLQFTLSERIMGCVLDLKL